MNPCPILFISIQGFLKRDQLASVRGVLEPYLSKYGWGVLVVDGAEYTTAVAYMPNGGSERSISEHQLNEIMESVRLKDNEAQQQPTAVALTPGAYKPLPTEVWEAALNDPESPIHKMGKQDRKEGHAT